MSPSSRAVLEGRRSAQPAALVPLSWGDAVLPGLYALHSRFPEAVNFFRGGDLLVLAGAKVGAGPSTVVLRRLPPAGTREVLVEQGGLRLPGGFVPFVPALVYRSSLKPRRPHARPLGKGLAALLDWLPSGAPAGSLAFLAGRSGGSGRKGSFDSNLREWMLTSCRKMFGPDLLEGVRLAAGAGPGLTPAGDDLLCGVLAALDVIERVSGKDLGERREEVLRNAIGRNALSNAFLGFGRRGLYGWRHRAFLEAFLDGGEERVLLRAADVAAWGATSGADWLTGFCLAMRSWSGLWS